MRANRPIMLLAVAAAAGGLVARVWAATPRATSRPRGRVATTRTVTTGRSLPEPENPTSWFGRKSGTALVLSR
jgi:hypothetical protein